MNIFQSEKLNKGLLTMITILYGRGNFRNYFAHVPPPPSSDEAICKLEHLYNWSSRQQPLSLSACGFFTVSRASVLSVLF